MPEVDRVVVPHIDDIFGPPYAGFPAWSRYKGTLLYRCNCGEHVNLSLEGYTIADNGDVSPMQVCNYCHFDVWIHLQHWTLLVDGWGADHPNATLRPR